MPSFKKTNKQDEDLFKQIQETMDSHAEESKKDTQETQPDM